MFISSQKLKSNEQISVIDVRIPSLALKFNERMQVLYFIVLLNVLGLLVITSFKDFSHSNILFVTGNIVLIIVLACLAYYVWRAINVIDTKFISIYQTINWLLLVLLILLFIFALVGFQNTSLEQELITIYLLCLLCAHIVLSIIGVIVIKRYKITVLDEKLFDVIGNIKSFALSSHVALRNAKARNSLFGYILIAIALLIYCLPAIYTEIQYLQSKIEVTSDNVERLLGTLAAILLFYAGKYFQVDVDSLLNVDRRPPVLFLRSFMNDLTWSSLPISPNPFSWFDYSVELRLSRHFYCYGPFIAIGSPSETIPQIGAARAILSDTEWQEKVIKWMNDSSLIVMYCGDTKWVNWELGRIIENDCVSKLILLFPSVRAIRPSKKRKLNSDRFKRLMDSFKGTKWDDALLSINDYNNIKSIVFNTDGTLVIITSKGRSNESVHLSAIISHYHIARSTFPELIAQVHPTERKKEVIKTLKIIAATISLVLFGIGVHLQNKENNIEVPYKYGVAIHTMSAEEPVVKVILDQFSDNIQFKLNLQNNINLPLKITTDQSNYTLLIKTDSPYNKQEKFITDLGLLGSKISDKLKEMGKSFNMQISDANFQPLRPVPLCKVDEYNGHKLYFTEYVKPDIANGVGNALIQYGIFNKANYDRFALLNKKDNIYTLKLYFSTYNESSSDFTSKYTEISIGISSNVLGGEIVYITHCDRQFNDLDNSARATTSALEGDEAFRNKSYKQSIISYKLALGFDDRISNKSSVLFNLGKSYQEQGMINEAIIVYAEILEIEPRNFDAALNLAEVYKLKNMVLEAVNIYKYILQTDKNSHQAQAANNQINNISHANNLNASKVNKSVPSFVTDVKNIANEYQKSVTKEDIKEDKKIETPKPTSLSNPEIVIKDIRNKGLLDLSKKEYQTAIDSFLIVARYNDKTNIKDYDLYYFLATCYWMQKKYTEAYDYYSKCIPSKYGRICTDREKEAMKKLKKQT